MVRVEPGGETAGGGAQSTHPAGVLEDGGDLEAVADDGGVGEQWRHFHSGDGVHVEACEGTLHAKAALEDEFPG